MTIKVASEELCNTEKLVMTDANAMFEANAVRELVSFFGGGYLTFWVFVGLREKEL